MGVEILAAVTGVDVGLLLANLDVHRLVLLEQPKKTVLVFFDHVVDLLDIGQEIDSLRFLVLKVVFAVKLVPVNLWHFFRREGNVQDGWMLPNVEFLLPFEVEL